MGRLERSGVWGGDMGGWREYFSALSLVVNIYI